MAQPCLSTFTKILNPCPNVHLSLSVLFHREQLAAINGPKCGLKVLTRYGHDDIWTSWTSSMLKATCDVEFPRLAGQSAQPIDHHQAGHVGQWESKQPTTRTSRAFVWLVACALLFMVPACWIVIPAQSCMVFWFAVRLCDTSADVRRA